MPKTNRTKTAADIAAQAAARNTDSAPANPAPPTAGRDDAPARKAIDTQALAAAMPANTNKPLEHGETNALDAPVGLSAQPASRLPGASTLSEANTSDKVGSGGTDAGRFWPRRAVVMKARVKLPDRSFAPAKTTSRGSSPTSSVRTTRGGDAPTSTMLTLSER